MKNNRLILQKITTESLSQYESSFTNVMKIQLSRQFFESHLLKAPLNNPTSYENRPVKTQNAPLPFENHPVKNREIRFPFENSPVKNCPGNPVAYEKRSGKTHQGSFFLLQFPVCKNHFITTEAQGKTIILKKLFAFCILFLCSLFFLVIKIPYPLRFSQFVAGSGLNSCK